MTAEDFQRIAADKGFTVDRFISARGKTVWIASVEGTHAGLQVHDQQEGRYYPTPRKKGA